MRCEKGEDGPSPSGLVSQKVQRIPGGYTGLGGLAFQVTNEPRSKLGKW